MFIGLDIFKIDRLTLTLQFGIGKKNSPISYDK